MKITKLELKNFIYVLKEIDRDVTNDINEKNINEKKIT